jgi:hypothetical protein
VPTTPAAVEYITDLGPHDVLSGRGGATNSYRGNRAFRTLVKEYQDRYLRAKKRDKPAVASLIVETIRQRGGRFLRRESNHFRRQNHHVTDAKGSSVGGSMIHWVDIGDDRAREKTCQALREGAPELRRQGRRRDGEDHRWSNQPARTSSSHSFSFDDDLEEDVTSHGKDSASSEARESRIDKPEQRCRLGQKTYARKQQENQRLHEEDDSDVDDHTPEVRNGGRVQILHRQYPVNEASHFEEEVPIFIRPWARLLPDRHPVEPIRLDQLSVEDRNIYLRDFAPPNPRNEVPSLVRQHSIDLRKPTTKRTHDRADQTESEAEMFDEKDLYNSVIDSKPPASSINKAGPSQWSPLTA